MRIPLGERTIDLDQRAVTGPGGPRSLSPNELRLVRRLAETPGEPVPPEELCALVGAASDNALHRALVRLREKLEDDPRAPKHLVTFRGAGVALFVERPASAPPAVDALERAAVVRAIEQALAAPGIVTLLGPGGVGKTTLARVVASRAPTSLFCDLVPARGDEDLWRIVAGMAAEPVPAVARERRALAAALGRRGPLLVVFDNAEPLVEAVRDAVELLVTEAPELRALVTSRVPLHSPGERRIEVPLLELDEAVALYRLRGGVDEPSAVQALVAEFDRLPLVVELLASRSRGSSADELRAWFGARRGELLVSPVAPHVPDRHRTLEQVLEASWALLGPAEQRALARLSVVPGRTPLALAERLCGGLDPLQLLAEAGLVQVRPGAAATLEGVRLFASSALDALGERADALSVALRWATARAAPLPDEPAEARSERLFAELDLLWAVFRDAVDPTGRAALARHLLGAGTNLPLGQREQLCAVVIADGGEGVVEALLVRAGLARYAGDEAAAPAVLAALGDVAMMWRMACSSSAESA
ncbi:MAG: winged helix-turn-helix domain-containing protein, partial [Myxococcota bacterium]